MERVLLQPASVLHHRPYRDTSALVDVFTREYGRFRVLVKGLRNTKSSLRGTLQAFQMLVISWQARSAQSLPILTYAELAQPRPGLQGRALLCGFYLNELLMRVLHEHDAHADIYDQYQTCLTALSTEADITQPLRKFEFQLLASLGYGICFDREGDGITPIDPNTQYVWQQQAGFMRSTALDPDHSHYPGAFLLALAQEGYASPLVKQYAKTLVRELFAPLLGPNPLMSRGLFLT